MTLALEEGAPVSMPLGANAMRTAGDAGARLRDLPQLTATSPEATAIAVGHLQRCGLGQAGRNRTLVLPPPG